MTVAKSIGNTSLNLITIFHYTSPLEGFPTTAISLQLTGWHSKMTSTNKFWMHSASNIEGRW